MAASEVPESGELTLAQALMLAISAHKAGDLDAAEAVYGSILAVAPDDPDALHFLGLLYGQRGRYEAAIDLIGRAIAVDPKVAASQNNLGNAFTELGRLDEAAEAYRRALELEPEWADTHANLGALLRRRGKLREAEDSFRRAIAIEPRHVGAHLNLGNLLVATGRKSEGIACMCKAITFEPHNPQSWRKLGLAYSIVGDLESAAGVYRQWLARNPDDPIARHLLAACTGEAVPARASDPFIEKTFDSFASSFDARLEQLEYRAPTLVAGALARELGQGEVRRHGLDAGCGTGLCGPLLRPKLQRLTGVDLSAKMLERASARGTYDDLVRAELTAHLLASPAAYDVIVSADTLVYFGDLEAVIGAAAQALEPGGTIVFTLEDAGGSAGAEGHLLRPHGRYAHARAYVERVLAAAGLDRVTIAEEVLRHEAGQPVAGLLVMAMRPKLRQC